MRFDAPHPIPYQGSKRQLSPAILSLIRPGRFQRLVEPFAGSAAVTLAAATRGIFTRYLIADVLCPLMALWQQILDRPDVVAQRYREIWNSQLDDPRRRYDQIRDEFNRDHEPAKLLFLLARCVKNSVRFNPSGQFNQSPDNRRLGMRPDTMDREIHAAGRVLTGRCEVHSASFEETLKGASPEDLIYLDPPYQGTSDGRDRRYLKGVDRAAIIRALEDLNRRRVKFVLSYDGSCGEKTYGEPLPDELAHRVFIDAGRSSQGTLNGRNLRTVESLYVSHGLCTGKEIPRKLHWREPIRGALLFP